MGWLGLLRNDFAYVAATHVADQYAAVVGSTLLGPQVEAEGNRVAAIAHGHAGGRAMISGMDGASVAGTEFHLDVHCARFTGGSDMGRKLTRLRCRLLGGNLLK